MAEEYDLSVYPPSPILLATKGIDLICSLVGCSEWRSSIPSGLYSWLQFRVGDVRSSFPSMLTYDDYLAGTSQDIGWSSAFQYAFETPSTSLGDLTTFSAMMVLFFLVLLLRSIKGTLLPLFSSIGRKAGRRTHGNNWELDNEMISQSKDVFTEFLNSNFIVKFPIVSMSSSTCFASY